MSGADPGTAPRRDEDFAEFVRSRWGPLVRLGYAVTGDVGRAEDVVQEAFARLWPRWSRLRDEDPYAYARRMVVNGAVSAGRRPWRREQPASDVGDSAVVPAQDLDRVADRAALAQALARLPVRQRAVIVLRYAEGLSEAQVADLLGCTTGTVKSQASRGLARLRASHEVNPAALCLGEGS